MQTTPVMGIKKYEATDKFHLADQSANHDTLEAALVLATKTLPAGGTATAITLTLANGPALFTGMVVSFIASASNSSAATTINYNSSGVKNFYKQGTTTAPKLVAGRVYDAYYDGTSFFLKASAVGDATAGDVLAGKTFSNGDDVDVAGTLTLSGTAGVGDVVNGKTFYNTDAKTQQTGTGASAKRFATNTLSGGPNYSTSALGFTPSKVIVKYYGDSSNASMMAVISSTADLLCYNNSAGGYVFRGTTNGSSASFGVSAADANNGIISGGL